MLNRGFSLLELVLTLLVLALSLSLVVSALLPNHQQSTGLWQQVRAAELAQSILNEIQARAFDEHSSRDGGELRCDEAGALACAASFPACPASGMTILTEENSRAEYDDVDDYHCYRGDGSDFTDLLGQDLRQDYQGFQVSVQMSYAGTSVGLAERRIKRIRLTITAPDGSDFIFHSLKGNW